MKGVLEMKNIIIILGTVLLGIYSGTVLINGDSDSLKSGAADIISEVNQEITEGYATNTKIPLSAEGPSSSCKATTSAST